MSIRLGRRQHGLTTVEFAIVGTVFFVILFGVIEVGRALFVWNAIAEATRRGARVAAVCPPNHGGVARATVFSNNPGDVADSPILYNLTTANVTVTYLEAQDTDADGVDDTLAVTGGAFPIDYVQVEITGYQHTLLIPLLTRTITVPPFITTLPAESLGWNPDTNSRECFGAAS